MVRGLRGGADKSVKVPFFNLIVTSPQHRELEAIEEVERICKEFLGVEAVAWRSGVKGVILVRAGTDPDELIEGLREVIRRCPWEIRYMKRVIPVDKVVRTSVEEIEEAAKELVRLIHKGERFRVTVEKRHTRLSRREVIDRVARHVDAEVDLSNPDKILLIEIIGKYAGISILSRDRKVINVDKEVLSSSSDLS
mgnify:CR=1 FL=1